MDVGHLNPNDSNHSTSPLAHPEQNAPTEDLLNGTPLADAEPTEQPPAPAVAERSQSLSIPSYLSWAACSTLSLPVTATKLCYAGGCAAINYITNPQQHVDLRNAVANADADPIMQVKQIIKNNPRVKANVPDENGMTALHHTAKKGHNRTVRTLLKIGGSVHAKTNRGETPLHLAAQKTSSIQVMRQLINAGANVNATDNDKRTPIYYATVNSQADDHRKLSTLLSQPSINVDQCTTLGVTPLYTAITEGSPSGSQQTDRQRLFNQRAKLLLTKTEKIDQRFPKNEDNTTLLMHAIKHGNNEMATALINEGANIHIQNDLGLDALKIAIQQKNQEMVELLLDKGASIYAKDKQGKTALHHAAANPNISCAQMVDVVKNQSFAMRWLYSEKWYINQTDNDDQSALHIAYEKGNRNAVTLLTRNGADETLIDAYGNTPAENKPLRS